MQAYLLTLSPETAFGTPLVGDTLFGQICWGIAEQYGETRLEACLQGYTADHPFLVVSDAFPQNHLPLPTLPSGYWQQVPQVSIAQTYLKIMNRFCEQFGLTPSARSRMIVDAEQRADSDTMELLLLNGGKKSV